MTKLHWTGLGSALLASLAIGAASPVLAQLKAIELAVEARADAAVLPSGPASTLVVTPCTGCNQLSLPASERSRYFVGQELVSLSEFKRRLANRPTAMLVIFYLKESHELSRIVASAP
jgi:hypothetical protein